MTHADRTLPVRASLVRKLWQPTPRVVKQVKRKPVQPTKEPDWAILEVRRLRETHGRTYGQIAAHMTAQGVPMAPDRAASIGEYCTRSHLVPDHNRTTPYAP